MIRAGIIGATGYAGAELVRILMGHKGVEIVWYGSRSYIDERYANVYRNMFEIVDAKCMDDNMEELADRVYVIFTATPQGFLASVLTEEILSKVKVIDLSADFRIKDVGIYEKWYGIEHKSPQFIEGEPGADPGSPSDRQSGLLYYLFYSDGVSVGERGIDRYGYFDRGRKVRDFRSGTGSQSTKLIL